MDYRYYEYQYDELHRKCKFWIKVAAVGVVIGLILLIFILAFRERTDYEMDTYVVKSGDTLWEIAGEFKPDGMNYDEYIHNIREDNGLDSSMIYPGQRLEIRIYED